MIKTVSELNILLKQIEEEDYIEEDDFEEEEENNIIEDISNAFSNIEHLRCAEHSLQLAINSCIKDFEQVLEKVRSIMKLLRTQIYSIVLHTNGIGKPVLDVVTRWGSTYKMVEYFFHNYDFIKSIDDPKIKLSEIDEDSLRVLFDGLKDVYILTKKLQSSDLLLSDAFIIWTECLEKLKNHQSSEFHSKMIECITKRNELSKSKQLIKNAIFSDPRLKCILNEDEIQSCVNYFKKFHDEELKIQTDTDETQTFLGEFIKKNSKIPKIEKINSKIEIEVSQYLNLPIENVNSSPLQFWFDNSTMFPILSQICSTSLIVPATQVSVESLFSDLAFIMSPLRSRLLDRSLKNILLIRKNRDIFNKI